MILNFLDLRSRLPRWSSIGQSALLAALTAGIGRMYGLDDVAKQAGLRVVPVSAGQVGLQVISSETTQFLYQTAMVALHAQKNLDWKSFVVSAIGTAGAGEFANKVPPEVENQLPWANRVLCEVAKNSMQDVPAALLYHQDPSQIAAAILGNAMGTASGQSLVSLAQRRSVQPPTDAFSKKIYDQINMSEDTLAYLQGQLRTGGDMLEAAFISQAEMASPWAPPHPTQLGSANYDDYLGDLLPWYRNVPRSAPQAPATLQARSSVIHAQTVNAVQNQAQQQANLQQASLHASAAQHTAFSLESALAQQWVSIYADNRDAAGNLLTRGYLLAMAGGGVASAPSASASNHSDGWLDKTAEFLYRHQDNFFVHAYLSHMAGVTSGLASTANYLRPSAEMAESLLDLGADFSPVTLLPKAGTELLTGYDPVTLVPVNRGEAGLMGSVGLFGTIGKFERAGQAVAEWVKGAEQGAKSGPGMAEAATTPAVVKHPLEGWTPEQVVQYVDQLGLKTPRDQLILWSGLGKADAGKLLSQEYAAANGGVTLEMTAGGKWLDEQNLFSFSSPFTRKEALQIWADVSTRMIQQASGQVRSLIGSVNPSSIYRQEQVELLMNKQILGLDELNLKPKYIFGN